MSRVKSPKTAPPPPAWMSAVAAGNVVALADLTDVNEACAASHGFTPLEYAIQNGQTGVLCHLVDVCGADVNRLSTIVGWPPLMACVFARSVDATRALLLRGARVNQTARDGDTALATALRGRNVACAQLLLRYGASLALVRSPLPPWARPLAAVECCRRAALILVGVRQRGRSALLNSNARDVVALIARHVLSTRNQIQWTFIA